jgi:hypothetical protein
MLLTRALITSPFTGKSLYIYLIFCLEIWAVYAANPLYGGRDI